MTHKKWRQTEEHFAATIREQAVLEDHRLDQVLEEHQRASGDEKSSIGCTFVVSSLDSLQSIVDSVAFLMSVD